MEDLDKFLINYKLAYNPKIIYESLHVTDNLNILAKHIAELTKMFILDELNNYTINELNELEPIYSGYNFNVDYKNSIHNNIKPEPVLKLGDDNKPYPIYFQYSYIDNSSKKANVIWRDKNIGTQDKIYIDINLYHFKDITYYKNYILLISTISHELQHVFDMYILPEFNRLDKSIKYGLTVDFEENDIFKLDKNLNGYRYILIILSMCSLEERNTRLAELKSLLDDLKCNKKLTDKIFKDTLTNYIQFPKILNHNLTITKNDLYTSISNNNVIQTVTRINLYKTIIDKIKNIKNEKTYNKIMFIIGYYLYKHKQLKLTDNHNIIVKKILSDSNNIDNEYNYKVVNDCILNSILYYFKNYVKYVNIYLEKHMSIFYDLSNLSNSINNNINI